MENDHVLLPGVEPMEPGFFREQGHRYTTCPDYRGIQVIPQQTVASALSAQPTIVLVAFSICSCGCVTRIVLA